LFDEPTVVSARSYHQHLCRSIYLVEFGAVFVKKRRGRHGALKRFGKVSNVG